MGTPIFMDYDELREEGRNLFIGETPDPEYRSLPLPTKRWSCWSYAIFSSLIENGLPVRISPPVCWWALQGQSSHLLFYAQTKLFPFAENMVWKQIALPEETRSSLEMEQLLSQIEGLMNQVVEAFFMEQPAEPAVRHQLNQALLNYLPAPLHPWYQALSPDFFAWLTA